MSELLFEIGTEEIPAGYIQPALDTLGSAAADKLSDLGLSFSTIQTFGTPRRLTLTVVGLQSRQPDRSVEHLGPSRKAAVDGEGKWTRAAEGFARSHGVEPDQLRIVTTPKGEYVQVVEDVQGQETAVLLPALLESLIHELVFPKSMRWADYSLTFARPIQWLLVLYDGVVLPLTVGGVTSSNTTRGHRFMAPETVPVTGIENYLHTLAERFVIADPVKRKAMVVEEVTQVVAATAGTGAQPVLHEGLLDTITNLVELPCAVCGRFDQKFLQLPEETLITSMREHQKYFPVVGQDGKLLPLFVAVNNTRVTDQKLATSGHERVLRARLEDGLFFLMKIANNRWLNDAQSCTVLFFRTNLEQCRIKVNVSVGWPACLPTKLPRSSMTKLSVPPRSPRPTC